MTVEVLYVAGPMRNFDQFNFPAFHECASYLRSAGFAVLSPAEHDESEGFDPSLNSLDGFDFQAAFRWDVQALSQSDAVVLLPGWEKSEGTKRELMVAGWCGLRAYRYDPSEPEGWRLGFSCPPSLLLDAVEQPTAKTLDADGGHEVRG